MDTQTLGAAYVLHTRRFGDSSLVVELLTRMQGRVACMAKGVLRTRRGEVRMQPFHPLLIGLRGRGEVLTLTHSEAGGAPLRLAGRTLYCGLYLNELLLRLTARHDPCPEVFDDYEVALGDLAHERPAEPTLRRFEVHLLDHLGFGLALEVDELGRPIHAASSYNYDADAGARPCAADDDAAVRGSTLLALRTGEFGDAASLREARELMRRILQHHLGGRPLRSRELFR